MFTTTVPFTSTQRRTTTPYRLVPAHHARNGAGLGWRCDAPRSRDRVHVLDLDRKSDAASRARGSARKLRRDLPDTGSDARFTTFTYSTTTAINLSLPTSKVVKNNASSTVAETKFYYDNASFGSTTKGNLTKEENWIGGSTYASTTKGYN